MIKIRIRKLFSFILILAFLTGCYNSPSKNLKVDESLIINVEIKFTTPNKDCVNLDSMLIEYSQLSRFFRDGTKKYGYTNSDGIFFVKDTIYYKEAAQNKNKLLTEYYTEDLLSDFYAEKWKYQAISPLFIESFNTIKLEKTITNYNENNSLLMTDKAERNLIQFNNEYGSTVIQKEIDDYRFTPMVSYMSPNYLLKKLNEDAEKQFWTDREKQNTLATLPIGGKLHIVTYGILPETAIASSHKIIIRSNGEIISNFDLANYSSIPRYYGYNFKKYMDEFTMKITEAELEDNFEIIIVEKYGNAQYHFSAHPNTIFNPNCE